MINWLINNQVDPEGICLTNYLQRHGKFGGWN